MHVDDVAGKFLADTYCHVTGCHVTQEARVQDALDYISSNICQATLDKTSFVVGLPDYMPVCTTRCPYRVLLLICSSTLRVGSLNKHPSHGRTFYGACSPNAGQGNFGQIWAILGDCGRFWAISG